MVKINEHFLTMKKNYLFIDIAKKIKAYSAAHPDKPLIRMGIGDVTLPLAPVVVEAIKRVLTKWALRRPSRVMRTAAQAMTF